MCENIYTKLFKHLHGKKPVLDNKSQATEKYLDKNDEEDWWVVQSGMTTEPCKHCVQNHRADESSDSNTMTSLLHTPLCVKVGITKNHQ
jgi:hypothetical protein